MLLSVSVPVLDALVLLVLSRVLDISLLCTLVINIYIVYYTIRESVKCQVKFNNSWRNSASSCVGSEPFLILYCTHFSDV